MNQDEVAAKIESDIIGAREHAEDIRKLTISPVPEMFEDVDGEKQQLWIVGKYEEYYLTFNAASGRYGLAYRSILNEPLVLSDEGGIGDAYEALVEK